MKAQCRIYTGTGEVVLLALLCRLIKDLLLVKYVLVLLFRCWLSSCFWKWTVLAILCASWRPAISYSLHSLGALLPLSGLSSVQWPLPQ
jgi:hypothetical protein